MQERLQATKSLAGRAPTRVNTRIGEGSSRLGPRGYTGLRLRDSPTCRSVPGRLRIRFGISPSAAGKGTSIRSTASPPAGGRGSDDRRGQGGAGPRGGGGQ